MNCAHRPALLQYRQVAILSCSALHTSIFSQHPHNCQTGREHSYPEDIGLPKEQSYDATTDGENIVTDGFLRLRGRCEEGAVAHQNCRSRHDICIVQSAKEVQRGKGSDVECSKCGGEGRLAILYNICLITWCIVIKFVDKGISSTLDIATRLDESPYADKALHDQYECNHILGPEDSSAAPKERRE
jgi:hypothetical protein